MNSQYAIVGITEPSIRLGQRLHKLLPASDLFCPQKLAGQVERTISPLLFTDHLRTLLPRLFRTYNILVLILPLGAVIRLLAPHIQNKWVDPGVIVIDQGGKFIISALSGHRGRANVAAKQIATLLQATPVLTTADEAQATIPADIFGQEFGWDIEGQANLTRVSADIISGNRIAVVQESGELDWLADYQPLPRNIRFYTSLELAAADRPKGLLMVTHRRLAGGEDPVLQQGVIYRPKVIVIGIGCRRGTPAPEIENAVIETMNELQFAISSIKRVCTIDEKRGEPGLLEVVNKYGWEFDTYSATQLGRVKVNRPSDLVYKHMGTYGVSAPAALLGSKAKQLALEKKSFDSVTVSVAIIPFTPHQTQSACIPADGVP